MDYSTIYINKNRVVETEFSRFKRYSGTESTFFYCKFMNMVEIEKMMVPLCRIDLMKCLFINILTLYKTGVMSC